MPYEGLMHEMITFLITCYLKKKLNNYLGSLNSCICDGATLSCSAAVTLDYTLLI